LDWAISAHLQSPENDRAMNKDTARQPTEIPKNNSRCSRSPNRLLTNPPTEKHKTTPDRSGAITKYLQGADKLMRIDGSLMNTFRMKSTRPLYCSRKRCCSIASRKRRLSGSNWQP